MRTTISSSRGRRAARALLVVVTLALATGPLPASGATAGPPTDQPRTAARYGAHWLAGTVTAGGYVEDANGAPAPGPTVSVGLALAAAGSEDDALARVVAWVSAHVDDYVVVDNGGSPVDSPGNLGYLLVLVRAVGRDATSFGGSDLVARLQATLGAYHPTPGTPVAGLYGATDPTYDGAFRQSLAVLGLVAAGVTPPGAALDWLVAQQCAPPSSAAGGWQAYRADPSSACDPPDPSAFTGPDTNSTALALEALAAAGRGPSHDGLAFLAAAQEGDGGFGFIGGGGSDPNSTALVIQGIVAAGESPAGGRWRTASGATPFSSLLSWQLGCDAAPADQGAFASPYSAQGPDAYATEQAVWGASGQAFPLSEATGGIATEPACVTAVTTPVPSTVAQGSGPAEVAGLTTSSAATPLAVHPSFTG